MTIPVLANEFSPNEITVSVLNTTDSKAVHPKKQKSGISDIVAYITTFFKFIHPEKTLVLIWANEVGIVIELKLIQSLKAA